MRCVVVPGLDDRKCSYEGCENPLRARGWCATHWARWRKHGTPDGAPPRAVHAECVIPDCGGKPRSKHAEYCEMHYGRVRRQGDPHKVLRVSGDCTVDGCSEAAFFIRGLCRKHDSRLKRNGHFDLLVHHAWTGDSVTYFAMHRRLRSARGRASDYLCVDCGRRGQQWSYNRRAEVEKMSSLGPYSADLNDYDPRCISCHKKFDLRAISAGA